MNLSAIVLAPLGLGGAILGCVVVRIRISLLVSSLIPLLLHPYFIPIPLDLLGSSTISLRPPVDVLINYNPNLHPALL